MLEQLAREIGDQDVAKPDRRRSPARVAVALIAALLTATAATTVTAATVFDVSLGVPVLDRFFEVQRDVRPPSTPRPKVVVGSTSPPVAVPASNGAAGATAVAFVDQRRRLCITTTVRGPGADQLGNVVPCAAARPLSRLLQRRPVLATTAAFGPTSIVAGFTRADVLEVKVRAPNGRPMNVELLKRLWIPKSAHSARPMRVFIGAYRLTRGRLDADTLNSVIDLSKYRVRARMRNGREITTRFR
jgi:hypothetical protein